MHRGGMISAHSQAVHLRLGAIGMALQAVRDALPHLFSHLALVRHVYVSLCVIEVAIPPLTVGRLEQHFSTSHGAIGAKGLRCNGDTRLAVFTVESPALAGCGGPTTSA